MPLVTRPDGRLVVVCGASRSGKTAWTAQQVKRAARLLVWDSVGEWADRYGCERVATLSALAAAVRPPARAGRLAFYGSPPQFDTFCRLAWVWLRAARGALVVEELADVTHPGKAPLAWGEIVRKGLRYGVDVYALTQRPSESDKSSIGNASVIHSHRMARDQDRRYIAAELGVPVADVEALAPLQWIERDALGAVRRGAVKFARNRPPAAQVKQPISGK